MKTSIQFKTIILSVLVVIVLGCFGLLPKAQAVTPAPDGGYGNQNTAEGTDALFSLTTGVWNVAVGFQALNNDTTGNQNTATGYKALFSNNTGSRSTAYGSLALSKNTTGSNNVATGFSALSSNITGNNNTGVGFRALNFTNSNNNTAIGFNALYNNRPGSENTAIGSQALFSNNTGKFNDAVGAFALFKNSDGTSNNAFGDSALFNNIHASGNTAVGDLALGNNDSTGKNVANFNTAVGASALSSNTDGNSNNAVGFNALGANTDGLSNNAMGFGAMADNVHGSGNVAVGDSAGKGVEGDFNIYIGFSAGPAPSPAPVAESETIRIGDVFNRACYIGGISGETASGGAAVFIIGNGKLGTLTSSARFKDDIKPMDNASEALLALKPVTFRYKKEIDPAGISQFGLVAEEVEKVSPDLVVRDKEGKPYSVRYEQVNAMLLNEFLKEHQKVQELEATIAQIKSSAGKQEAATAQQQKQIEALTTGLQKVSAQIEVSKPAPQTVANN